MRRAIHLRNHTIVYEHQGAEVARYTARAQSELEAELETSALFFKEHPRFDEFDPDSDLTFRIENSWS
jgi:hypothetical protein